MGCTAVNGGCVAGEQAIPICFQATVRRDVEALVADWLSAHAHTEVCV
jgi:hypothetical protein